jgi:hypothetical protein
VIRDNGPYSRRLVLHATKVFEPFIDLESPMSDPRCNPLTLQMITLMEYSLGKLEPCHASEMRFRTVTYRLAHLGSLFPYQRLSDG